ncbi:hypothetical protein BDW02DRAFT_11939 [Decorospora gaudefroyi]|uniref:Uncharacterized protein n=1 Tax=Decorospora gaudefroyi TaxID=184978 RepID=A0A6A5KTQ2_9PLEO|nr:hypothetical protein BDW02DRAFT_11939 [Decorospora gaudefroyi]
MASPRSTNPFIPPNWMNRFTGRFQHKEPTLLNFVTQPRKGYMIAQSYFITDLPAFVHQWGTAFDPELNSLLSVADPQHFSQLGSIPLRLSDTSPLLFVNDLLLKRWMAVMVLIFASSEPEYMRHEARHPVAKDLRRLLTVRLRHEKSLSCTAGRSVRKGVFAVKSAIERRARAMTR